MTQTTTEQRQRLRELHAAATKGPWHTFNSQHRPVVGVDAPQSRIAQLNIGETKSQEEITANGELIVESVNAVPALLSDLDAAEAELSRLRTALAEAERDAEINRNAYRDLKSQHSELRNAVGRGKGCCCQMCLPDIADEVEVWKRKAARWDECKARYLVRNGMGEFLSSPYLEPNADAAIDAAIEAREQETT